MIKLAALLPEDDGGATLRFSISDEDGEEVGQYLVTVEPTAHGTTDSLIGRGYREMAEILDGWRGRLFQMAAHYEERSAH